MNFTMWLGPMPIRWLARIENVVNNGHEASFEDRQVKGPFTKWVHRHAFVTVYDEALGRDVTEVHDTVDAEYSSNLFWKLVGIGMWSGMSALFAFRSWKTRRLLEQGYAYQAAA
ncbi:MAG: hypothetical protein AAF639_25905 [Chloroflexota bacterium]